MAAINTTAGLVTNVVYDLCANPEYIDQLRDEIDEMLGGQALDRAQIMKFRLLDNVIKESQRLNPLGLSKSARTPQMPLSPMLTALQSP